MPSFDIVVSAENNHYMQWQAMMFHYSCKTMLGRLPVIVVHTDGDPLADGFELIKKDGGRVQLAPTMRNHGGVEYPPRNTAAALQAAETSADYVILCDADMLFFRPLPLDDLAVADDTISFDRVSYLNADDPKHTADVAHACAADGLDPVLLSRPRISGGVPHVIPTHIKADLSREWLRYIDLFPVIDHPPQPSLPKYSYPKGPHLPWLATMWAVILAMHRLGLRYIETSWCVNNRHGQQRLSETCQATHCMVHYCFDGVEFNKRMFKWDVPIDDPEFWSSAPPDETIDGFVRGQFRKTAEHFQLTV